MIRRLLFALCVFAVPAQAATIACNTTAGTKNWSAGGSWVGGVAPGSGDTATCATATVILVVDVNTTVGTSPVAGTNVVTFTGSTLALGHNITLTALGGVRTGTLVMAAGSKIHFDSTAAASPTATSYSLTTNTFTDDGTFPPLNTVGNVFSVDANNSTGTNWKWLVATAGSGVSGLHNFNFSNCGDSANANRCLDYADGGSGVVTISHGVFNTTCGIKFTGFTANDGINMTGVTFKNTYTACNTIAQDSHITVTNTCSMTGMVFDRKPFFQVPGCTVSGIFYGGMSTGFQAPTVQATMTHSLLINNGGSSNSTTQLGAFNWDHSSIWEDGTTTYSAGQVQAPTAYRSGTVTGCTSTTATDSTASFPSTMIDDLNTSSSGYVWVMTTGAAAGQVSNIKTAATTVVTMWEPFVSTCSSGDHYVVYKAEANPHYMTIVPNVSPWVGTHLIGWFNGGDWNGDFIHGTAGITTGVLFNLSYITVLPTVAKNQSGTAGTLSNNGSIIPVYNIDHFTYFLGSQSFSACEGSSSCPNAGTIHTFVNNIAYDDPAYVYPGVSNQQQSIGPYKLETTTGLPNTFVADLVAANCNFGFGTQSCADFNFGYGSVPHSATSAPNGYSFVATGVGNKGYNMNSSVAMGPHDVDGVNPQFADPYPNPIKYAQANGIGVGQVDPFQVFPLLLNDMMAVNDPGGSPHGTSPDGFYNYVATALGPHNAAYHNAGSDGGDVGAWPYIAPTSTSRPFGQIF